MTDTRHKILVVDDLPDWRKTLSGVLTDEGYKVEVAGSLSQALELLTTDHFDLAVVDIRLDDSDESNIEGLDLAAKIRNLQPDVKVVIITAYSTPDTIKRAMQPDAQGQKLVENYVLKTQTNDLVEIVRSILQH